MNDVGKRIAALSPAKLKLLQQRMARKEGGVERHAITRKIASGPAPLSFAQQRQWFLDRLEVDSAVYNIPFGLRLGGVLNVPVLQRCLSEVVRRHESLRTRFEEVEGQPVQVIQPAASLAMPIIDLGGLPEPEREADARNLCVQESQRHFDLARDILLRAKLFRLGETDHILCLTVHHIASDGWSMGLLIHELSTLYEAFVDGRPSPLPELPLQYADFAVWQRGWLQGQVLEGQLSYWRKQLDGVGAPLELPTDRTRPATQSYRGALRTWELPKPLSVALTELSQREDATLFMTLLAAFQTLLQRYTGGEDILVGSPIAGRNWMEIEPLIGFFINTLVLRGDLSGNPSFRSLLGRTRKAALEAYAHQHLPFERLVEELHPERDLSRSPLFQVMFILQNAPRETAQLAGLEVTPLQIGSGTSKFDLTISIKERGGVLHAMAEYNTDLFEAETIRRMLGHYQSLLEGIVANPDQRLSDLPLLTSAEQHQLLVEWNGTEVEYPKDRPLHELIEEQAGRTPEAVAISFENQQMNYRQLNERAHQLARHLQGLGVGPDTLVGICVERSLEMVVGLLGILKAGAAYVPLDPTYPKERLAFMLGDSGVQILLSQASLKDSLPAHQAKILLLDGDWPAVAKESSSNPQGSVAAHHTAYLIYTSGSTGKPKGVQIQYGALVNFLHSMRTAPGLTAQDRFLALTALSFDIAGLELWLPLMVGAQIVMANREQARGGQALEDLLARCDPTVMQATPSIWKMLMSGDWKGSPHLKILCGGEAWPKELAQQLLPKCGSLWNMYGPTETTIWSAACKVNPDDEVLIGGPIANTRWYVLDKHLQLVPVGVAGELHIGGDGLALRYFKRPELTHERFVPDTFVKKPGARLYKTGDLVRWQSNGKMKFIGRTDHQVKIRGFRIELGEIESVLTAHPAVREAVVVTREDVPGDTRLVAYLTSQTEEAPKASELRSLLQSKLPEYMVPSAFVTLKALPLTPNGKVDRNALPKPDSPPSSDKSALPATPTEIALAKIWSEVLGVKETGLHDNFFEMGGHSLQAIRLLAAIHKSFGKAIPVASIFTAPTVLQFSKLLDENATGAAVNLSDKTRGSATGAPLFFIPGFEGYGFLPRLLARHLQVGCRIFDGLQYPGLNESEPLPGSIEEIAAYLIPQIQQTCPRGPYYLTGWSFGGVMAFEVARQMEALGLDVPLVMPLDSRPPGRGLRKRSVAEVVDHLGRHLSELSGRERALFFRDLAVNKFRFHSYSIRQAIAVKPKEHTTPLMEATRQAARRYRPGSYGGRVVLFQSEAWKLYTGFRYAPDPTFGWKELAPGGLEVISVPGDHKSMMEEPAVLKVAERMLDFLKQVASE